MKNFFDKKIVVFELANNHMGYVDHGIKIINTYGKLVKNYRSKFDFAFKFQYRQLSSFIHKDFKSVFFYQLTDDKLITLKEWRLLNSE